MHVIKELHFAFLPWVDNCTQHSQQNIYLETWLSVRHFIVRQKMLSFGGVHVLLLFLKYVFLK